MNIIEKRILQFLCLPGALLALIVYAGGVSIFRRQIVGANEINFKNTLTDSIAPVSTMAWLALVVFLIWNHVVH